MYRHMSSLCTRQVTGTSYFITEGETPFSDLPIIRYYEKKDLVPMLSLVDKVQSREEKLISKKIGLMVSWRVGLCRYRTLVCVCVGGGGGGGGGAVVYVC